MAPIPVSGGLHVETLLSNNAAATEASTGAQCEMACSSQANKVVENEPAEDCLGLSVGTDESTEFIPN
eukprot:4551397-Lingulodinium_polyedra.AAC.1